MRIVTLFLFFLVSCSSHGFVPKNWFVIAASSKSVSDIIAAKKSLGTEWSHSEIINSDDCTNFSSGLYVLIVRRYHSQEEAKKEVTNLKSRIPDAYIKQCNIKKNSLLAYNIPTVHNSIEAVPAETVNWTDVDRVSNIHLLNDGFALIELRIYKNTSEDPWEGRRTQIVFKDSKSGKKQLIEENCFDFGAPSAKNNLVMFHCAHTIAATHYIHRVVLYDIANSKIIKKIEYCKDPKLENEKNFKCMKESVNADGELVLKEYKFEL